MIEMINSNILVKPIVEDSRTSAGIFTTVVKSEPTRGEVISIGKGKYLPDGSREEHGIAVGDIIIFGQSGLGNKITHDGVEYLVMNTEAVLGIERS